MMKHSAKRGLALLLALPMFAFSEEAVDEVMAIGEEDFFAEPLTLEEDIEPQVEEVGRSRCPRTSARSPAGHAAGRPGRDIHLVLHRGSDAPVLAGG